MRKLIAVKQDPLCVAGDHIVKQGTHGNNNFEIIVESLAGQAPTDLQAI